MTYREHTAWVVKAYLQKHPEGNIMSVRYSWGCLPSLTVWFSLQILSLLFQQLGG